MRVPVCLSACFCGLNPRTAPQLSRNKFRAPLSYRGLVLGLNVSYFFRSLGTSNGARAEQTPPTPRGSRRHTYDTHKNCGQCWPPILDTCFCACSFSFFVSFFPRHSLSPPPPPFFSLFFFFFFIVQCRVVLCINLHHRS